MPEQSRGRLRLVLAGAAWRGRSSAAMFAIAVVASAAAAFGPIYLQSVDQTVLTSTLASANPAATGLTLRHVTATQRATPWFDASVSARRGAGPPAAARIGGSASRAGPFAQLLAARSAPGGRRAPEPPGGGRWFGAPIRTTQAGFGTVADGQPYQGTLVARTGACRDLEIVAGRCPAGPGSALLSTRSADLLHLRVGSELTLAIVASPARVHVVVAGLYLPGNPAAPAWWGVNYFGYGTGGTRVPKIDDVFTPAQTFHRAVPRGRTAAMLELPLRARSLTVGEAPELPSKLAAFAGQERRDGTVVSTRLDAVLGSAAGTEHTSGVIAAVVDLQLVLLALYVLYFVASRTAVEREPDVRLAELRGFRARSALGVAMAEPVVLVLAAVPAGILAAWGIAAAIAPAAFLTGVGASPTPFAVAAAAGAGVLGVAATVLGTRQALGDAADAPARSAGRSRTSSTWRAVGDAGVVAIAAAAFYELSTGGVGHGASGDALAAMAPGLLALAVGVLGARTWPALLRATHRWSAGTGHVAAALAARTVSRRREFTGQLVLVTLAVALATFAVAGWAVAARNRNAESEYQVGAARVLTVAVAPGATLLAGVRAADPGGHEAMAAVLERASNGTTLALDASRLSAVADWPSTLPPAGAIARSLVPRHLPPPVHLTGTSVALTVDTTALHATPPPQLSMDVFDTAYQAASQVTFGALRPGLRTYRAPIAGACGGGCRIVSVALGWTGQGRGATATVRLRAIAARQHRRWHRVGAPLDRANRWTGSSVSDVRAGAEGLSFPRSSRVSGRRPRWHRRTSPRPSPSS